MCHDSDMTLVPLGRLSWPVGLRVSLQWADSPADSDPKGSSESNTVLIFFAAGRCGAEAKLEPLPAAGRWSDRGHGSAGRADAGPAAGCRPDRGACLSSYISRPFLHHDVNSRHLSKYCAANDGPGLHGAPKYPANPFGSCVNVLAGRLASYPWATAAMQGWPCCIMMILVP